MQHISTLYISLSLISSLIFYEHELIIGVRLADIPFTHNSDIIRFVMNAVGITRDMNIIQGDIVLKLFKLMIFLSFRNIQAVNTFLAPTEEAILK